MRDARAGHGARARGAGTGPRGQVRDPPSPPAPAAPCPVPSTPCPAPRIGAHLAAIHEEHRTLDERAFYPAHAVRTESSAYTRARRMMVEHEDLPCRVCEVRHSTLRSRAHNVYGAKAMETHHHLIEWAHANAIDVERFNDQVVGMLRGRDAAKYGRRFSRAEMVAWIDHDRDNLWVLCDVHHRHRWFGVHAISGPVWQAQVLMRREIAGEIRRRLAL